MAEKVLKGVFYTDIPKTYNTTPLNSPVTPLKPYQLWKTGLTANATVIMDEQPGKEFLITKLMLLINNDPATDLTTISDGFTDTTYNTLLSFDYVGERPSNMVNIDFETPLIFQERIKVYMSTVGNTYRFLAIGYLREKTSS